MKTTLHKATTRGEADHGWLKSKHSFSFGSYHNSERMGFGLLRVINDDFVEPGKGFAAHPHKDMEIVSIPLKGSLKHKDSEGNEALIQSGEVQLMSAGSGVTHSEYNGSLKDDVNFLQIWIAPEKLGIEPRYDQKKFFIEERKNKFQTIVSPLGSDAEGVKINQQSYFSMLDLDEKNTVEYSVQKKGHGVYVFVVEGCVSAVDHVLEKRDGLGVENVDLISLTATQNSKLLLIEVPMIEL